MRLLEPARLAGIATDPTEINRQRRILLRSEAVSTPTRNEAVRDFELTHALPGSIKMILDHDRTPTPQGFIHLYNRANPISAFKLGSKYTSGRIFF